MADATVTEKAPDVVLADTPGTIPHTVPHTYLVAAPIDYVDPVTWKEVHLDVGALVGAGSGGPGDIPDSIVGVLSLAGAIAEPSPIAPVDPTPTPDPAETEDPVAETSTSGTDLTVDPPAPIPDGKVA